MSGNSLPDPGKSSADRAAEATAPTTPNPATPHPHLEGLEAPTGLGLPITGQETTTPLEARNIMDDRRGVFGCIVSLTVNGSLPEEARGLGVRQLVMLGLSELDHSPESIGDCMREPLDFVQDSLAQARASVSDTSFLLP